MNQENIQGRQNKQLKKTVEEKITRVRKEKIHRKQKKIRIKKKYKYQLENVIRIEDNNDDITKF